MRAGWQTRWEVILVEAALGVGRQVFECAP